MPEHSGLTQRVKRSTSDVEAAQSAPPNSKRLRVDHSPETSTRRDAKKRKKRRKKESVVAKLDHRHMQDTSSQSHRPPVSARNQIIRFTSTQPSGSTSRVQVPSDDHGGDTETISEEKSQSACILVCLVYCLFQHIWFPHRDIAQKGTDSSETANLSDTKQSPNPNSQKPSDQVVPEDKISQLTKELTDKGEVRTSS
jgi:hypothetical protein